ncbi:MAG: DUF2141 domain-containing protein [Treponema sp.]|nr:DUF2141 domain-containing protein [Treponema sp.]
MKRAFSLFVLSCIFSGYCFSQTVNNVRITVEITNAVINGGTVYLAIFSNAEEFRREEPYTAFELAANNSILSRELSLPRGEYVISAFQDANNNKTLDFGLFGIPRELVGISNYSGRGFPSRDFNRQKIMIDNTTGNVTIGLYKF